MTIAFRRFALVAGFVAGAILARPDLLGVLL